MAYKTIDETFWTDPDVKKKLTPLEKLFFLYLISNPHSHYSGIYYLPKSFIVDETGITLAVINKTLEKYPKMAQYDPEKEIIWVVNMAKHQIKQGNRDNLIKGIGAHLNTLHKSILIKGFLNHYEPLGIAYTIPSEWDTQPITQPIAESVTITIEGTGTITGTEEHLPRPDSVEIIISYLNQVLGTSYKASTDKTRDAIKARLSEGFMVENFKTVIDKKNRKWRGDPKMAEFLRPITLFGTKFESYLNEPEIPQVAQPKPSSMDKTLSALDEARLLVESRERQKVLGEGL